MTKIKDTKEKTVTVGCKLPNGVVLELDGKSVHINGANSSGLIGGHGITHNVDAEFFNAWIDAHSDRDMVKNGFIFAHGKPADTKAQAKEQQDNATGLEPVNPDDKGNGVETAKE